MTDDRWHRDRDLVLRWCADLTSLPRLAGRDAAIHLPAPFDTAAPAGSDRDGAATADAATEAFAAPLRDTFGHTRLDVDAVITEVDVETTDVAVMGRVTGSRHQPLLGIPPGDGPGLRIAAIVQVAGESVRRVHLLTDLPHLAHQAGIELLPPSGGRTGEHPVPDAEIGHPDGPDLDGAARTRRLITALIGGLNQLRDGDLASMPQEALWADDMRWLGPHGIGSCHGFTEYQDHAQGPSVRSFPDRRGVWPKPAFVCDGSMAAFVGWPGLVGTFDGEPFRGIEPSGGPISQRIIDVYRRRGDQLVDDWVFIDLVDFARQCGVDLLAPLG